MIGRRSFLLGLGAAVCAPAIIRPGILMPVKKMLAIGDGVALKTMAHPDVVVWFNENTPARLRQNEPTAHS